MSAIEDYLETQLRTQINEEDGKTMSVSQQLSIAYFNLGVEYEHLGILKDALEAY